jgi:hypothetical protein
MNIYYYLINLWPLMILLALILVIDEIIKLRQKHASKQP